MPNRRKFSRIIGATGVAPTENARARHVGTIFEFPMLMAALGILLRWWGETTNVELIYDSEYFDLFLWGLFVVESTLLSTLVTNKRRYLKENWLNVVIILLGIPVLMGWELNIGILRLLRLLIVFSLLVHMLNRVKKMLSQNELITTLIASSIVIVMSGVMIAALEPAIKSPLDGIWWAWVTVTTVGYGDVVPQTIQGRLFASIVILMGIALFSMITASFAAYFISQKEDQVLNEERDQYRKICDIEDRIHSLEKKLDELVEQLKTR